MKKNSYIPRYHVDSENVLTELRKYILADGFDFVLDLKKSREPYFYDSKSNKKFFDFFTCFASLPLGLNHPKMTEPSFLDYLANTAVNKPSNSDLYSEEMATFIKTFFEIAVPPHFKYSFFIDGGALAVCNALKTAFDWKVRKNFTKGYSSEVGTKVMHFRQAFHGRSGYTMSLTNTDPRKINYYPKFDWPRISNPGLTFPLTEENLAQTIEKEKMAVKQIKESFSKNKDEIAAIIIEPIQGEGGDIHFRDEFLKELKLLSLENDCLLIFDEVQTGVGITGSMWAHEQMNVKPDIMTFGKKMQICGILVGERVDEVPENVFHVSSRINSTWGGNLVDMVRATRYLEIIDEENLIQNVKQVGSFLLNQLEILGLEFPEIVSNVRGRGLFCAFDLLSNEMQQKFLKECFNEGLLILGCGNNSIRFRPPLNMTKDFLYEGIEIIRKIMKQLVEK